MHGNGLIIGDGSPAIDELFDVILNLCGSSSFLTKPVTSTFDLPSSTFDAIDYIVLCLGNRYPRLSDSFQSKLVHYVTNGGFLICMPFAAYSARFHGNSILEPILPCICESHFESEDIEIIEASILRPKGITENLNPGLPKSYFKGENKSLKNIAGEALSAKPNAEVLGFISTQGGCIPLALYWVFGQGRVFYYNLSYHPRTVAPGFFINRPSESTLAFKLLDSWTSLCMYEKHTKLIPGHKRLSPRLTRFVQELATRFQERDVRRSITGHSRCNQFDDIAMHYAHYGAGQSPRSLLFPSVDDFESLPVVLQAVIARCVLSATRILWVPDSPRVSVEYPAPEELLDLFRASNEQKKCFFEFFVLYFLLLIPCLSLEGQNIRTSTGEIDIVFANTREDPFWQQLDSRIPVECKNWNESIGAKEIRDFIGKIISLGCRSGIFASYNGFTGSYQRDALGVVREAFRDGITVVPIDLDDIVTGLRFIDPSIAIEAAAKKISIV